MIYETAGYVFHGTEDKIPFESRTYIRFKGHFIE